MTKENEIVIFETKDHSVSLPVSINNDTVWLNRAQMAELFGRDIKTIGKHINNALHEELSEDNSVVAKFATTAADGKNYMVEHYNLDVVVSVGYRGKSKRGVEFRRWASSVLKEYIIKGYVVNHNRMNQLNEVIRVMKRLENNLDTKQVLTVVERYNRALELLDSYDHQNMTRPEGNKATYVLDYEECRKVIDGMSFGENSSLFGKEKDDSFKGSIGAVYQSFAGKELYPRWKRKPLICCILLRKITVSLMGINVLRQLCFYTSWIGMELCLRMEKS